MAPYYTEDTTISWLLQPPNFVKTGGRLLFFNLQHQFHKVAGDCRGLPGGGTESQFVRGCALVGLILPSLGADFYVQIWGQWVLILYNCLKLRLMGAGIIWVIKSCLYHPAIRSTFDGRQGSRQHCMLVGWWIYMLEIYRNWAVALYQCWLKWVIDSIVLPAVKSRVYGCCC